MITQMPTEKMLEEWRQLWIEYKDKLQPNRKSGTALLSYLQKHYGLTEIHNKDCLLYTSRCV